MISLKAIQQFDFDAAEYRSLFERSSATAFQHPDWLTPFYRHMVSANSAEPLVIFGRNAHGRLILVVPLLKRRVGDSIVVEYASGGVTDYACPILAPELQASTTAGLPEGVADAIGPHDCLNIGPVRQDHLHTWNVLFSIQPRTLSFGTHAVTFGPSFAEGQLSTLKARRRSAFNRKIRQLTEIAPISLEVVDGKDLKDAFRTLRALRNGRFVGDPLQKDCGYGFYLDVASRGTTSGLARTYRLTQGDATIAVLFGIVERKRFCYLLLGCDYKQYGKYSPGQIMFDRVMRDWAEDGGQEFDFTIGDEPYKSVLGCHRRPLSSLYWQGNGTFPGGA